jgi:hypothetical protein
LKDAIRGKRFEDDEEVITCRPAEWYLEGTQALASP